MLEEKSEGQVLSPLMLGMLAGIMMVFTASLFYLFLVLLPEDNRENVIQLFDSLLFISADSRIVLLVMVSGALGSSVHSLTSFTTYAGRGGVESNWVWWYLMRPYIGTALALIFYLALRAGLFTSSASTGDINLYGILTISGLSGMFSRQATDKLSELFNNIFKTSRSTHEVP